LSFAVGFSLGVLWYVVSKKSFYLNKMRICSVFVLALMALGEPMANPPDYENVIRITPEMAAVQDGCYLIHLALDRDEPTPVLYNEAGIPDVLFDSAYPLLDTFVVLTPDNISGVLSVRKIIREGERVCVERTRFTATGLPEIRFREPLAPDTQTMWVYAEERYGSACCPRDPRWDIAPMRGELLAEYNQLFKRDVRADGIVRIIQGREGEHTDYYTLAGLNNAAKLHFLLYYDAGLAEACGVNTASVKPRIRTPYPVALQDKGIHANQLKN